MAVHRRGTRRSVNLTHERGGKADGAQMEWLMWSVAALALLATGFWSVWRHRHRADRQSLDVALSRARGAIELAEASQNAAEATNTQADAWLAEARHLMASAADPDTAARAERLATAADDAWRQGSGG